MSALIEHDECKFVDKIGLIIDHVNLERNEQQDVYIFLPEDSTVLELGARYGTVSCLISKILKDPTKHVAVEPDSEVIPALIKNKHNADAEFNIFNGAISKKPLKFNVDGYRGDTEESSEGNVSTLTLHELEVKYNLQFDTLVVDCEGCMGQFAKENNLSQFKMILLEKDNWCKCDYAQIESTLYDADFIQIKNNLIWSVYVKTTHLGFDIKHYTLPFGHLGLFGQLGFEENGIRTVMVDGHSISAHGSSTLIIETHIPFKLSGYISPTADSPPTLTFKCDGIDIGVLTTSGSQTSSIELLPGTHTLQIGGNSMSWAHSVWVLS